MGIPGLSTRCVASGMLIILHLESVDGYSTRTLSTRRVVFVNIECLLCLD